MEALWILIAVLVIGACLWIFGWFVLEHLFGADDLESQREQLRKEIAGGEPSQERREADKEREASGDPRG